jgi:hypothetical protein
MVKVITLVDAVKAAVTSEIAAAGKWVTAAKIAYHDGWRAAMVSGENTDKEKTAAMRAIIVQAFKPEVQLLLSQSGRDLIGMTEVEKANRRYWQQRCGTMIARMGAYLHQFDDSTPKAKKAKKTAATEVGQFTPVQTVAGYLAALRDMSAKITALKVSDKDNADTLSAELSERVKNALLDAIAVLSTAK